MTISKPPEPGDRVRITDHPRAHDDLVGIRGRLETLLAHQTEPVAVIDADGVPKQTLHVPISAVESVD